MPGFVLLVVRSSYQNYFVKKLSLKTHKEICAGVSLIMKLQAQHLSRYFQTFSCEFYETFKNSFLTEYVWMTASKYSVYNIFLVTVYITITPTLFSMFSSFSHPLHLYVALMTVVATFKCCC